MKYSDNVPYLDNHVLVAVKSAGLLTQPDNTGAPSLEEEMKAWIKEKENKKGNVFLHPIHRLDKLVSGLVLFAKTSKALSRLNEEMRENRIERVYVAEVEGLISENEGRLDHFLVHDEHKARIVDANHPEGKKARLVFQVIKRGALSTWVRISLETGRYHQIRAQFAAIKHPVVGDSKYGAKKRNENEIHLHCQRIAFEHPVTKELVEVESAVPF